MARFSTSEAPEHRAAAMSEAPLRHPEKAHKPDNPVLRKPDWIRVKAPTSPEYHETRALMRRLKLNTVCEEAACPNIGECWRQKHATGMILGSVCTRACACRRGGGPARLEPRRGHLGRSRRPGGRRRRSFRGGNPGDPRRRPGDD